MKEVKSLEKIGEIAFYLMIFLSLLLFFNPIIFLPELIVVDNRGLILNINSYSIIYATSKMIFFISFGYYIGRRYEITLDSSLYPKI